MPDKSVELRLILSGIFLMGDFFGSLSNGVDDLENFTSEMEWSFFVPVGFSCVFSNWYSYVSTPPAFPLAWIHVWIPAVDSQSSNALRPNWVSPRSPFRPGTLTWQARLLAFEQAWCSRAKRSVPHLVSVARSTTLRIKGGCHATLDGNEGGNDRFSCIVIVSFYSIAKIFCEYKKWWWKIIINTI